MRSMLLTVLTVTLCLASTLVFAGCCSHSAWAERDIPATCTERGIRGSECVKCGMYIDQAYWKGTLAGKFETVYIEPLGHDYVSTETPATSTAKGFITFKCSRCEDSYVMTHTPSSPATCTKAGNTEYYQRSTDGKYFADITATVEITLESTVLNVNADSHTGEWTTVKQADCENAGLRERTCTSCGQNVKETLPALGHNWSDWSTNDLPTCTQAVNRTHTCGNCGNQETDTLEALGHSFTVAWTWVGYDSAKATLTCARDNAHNVEQVAEITSKSTATCTQDGETVYTATVVVNGQTYTDTKTAQTEKTGHTEVVDEAVAPSCTATGKTEGKHCSACGAVLVEQQTLPIVHTDELHDGICDLCGTQFETVTSISTAAQLKGITNDLSGSYVLTEDIALTEDWQPLGTVDDTFTGKLYGNGHVISGLKFTAESAGGLFVSNNGTIDGVTLKDVSVDAFKGAKSAEYICGGFAAYNYGTIVNCSLEGSNKFTFGISITLVTESSAHKVNMGGLCGINYGTVSDCNVGGTATCSYVAGMTATWSGFIPPMYASCTFTTEIYFGNIAGKNLGTVKKTTVDCTNVFKLKGEAFTNGDAVASYVTFSVCAGSFVGVNEKVINNCSAKAYTKETQQTEGSSACHVAFNFNEDQRYRGLIGENKGDIEKLNIIFE